jgi:hypothetical protein
LPETTPVISAFEYQSGNNWKMFAANATKLYDVSSPTPVLAKSGQASGNYATAQYANAGGDFLTAVNDAGDPPLRFNGTSWIALDPSTITAWANSTTYAVGALAKDTAGNTYWRCLVAHTSPASGTFADARTASPTQWSSTASDGASLISGPAGTAVEFGKNLVYVWKYRNRLFFIEANSMNAWYLGIDAVGGVLAKIPLSGSFARGGKLLFGAVWSTDAGDGLDDKCCFANDLGEIIVFTGNVADSNSWRQEGRYYISPPLGMNAYTNIGGDLIIATVEGLVPMSAAITKNAGQLDLAMLTRAIKALWREEVAGKRNWPWTIEKWDEFGGFFVTTPGDKTPHALAANNATVAWARMVGWDATCFIRMRSDFFFGTQTGKIMQAERTGMDDGQAYVACLVGGWETFGSAANQFVWHQARAVFSANNNEPFEPQLAATVDYMIEIPPPPPPGPDPGIVDVWDQGEWGPDMGGPPPPVPTPPERARYGQWDQPGLGRPPNRNTMWRSIGMTGFSHAPIVQVTIAQQAKPNVELIAVSATFEPAGVNV